MRRVFVPQPDIIRAGSNGIMRIDASADMIYLIKEDTDGGRNLEAVLHDAGVPAQPAPEDPEAG